MNVYEGVEKLRESRRVWGVCWKLANGVWTERTRMDIIQACVLYSWLWESGVREVRIARVGVNR